MAHHPHHHESRRKYAHTCAPIAASYRGWSRSGPLGGRTHPPRSICQSCRHGPRHQRGLRRRRKHRRRPTTTDFIELFNPTAGPISLNGKSLQYRSAAGTAGAAVLRSRTRAGRQALPGPGSGMLGANGAALPAPDLDATANLNAWRLQRTGLSWPTRHHRRHAADRQRRAQRRGDRLRRLRHGDSFETATAGARRRPPRPPSDGRATADWGQQPTDFTVPAPRLAGELRPATPADPRRDLSG